jgi:hypothetical protein
VPSKKDQTARPLAASVTHRPECPVLLAVDQEFGEGATLWVAPELADPVGPVEVGEHQTMEKFGALSRTEASRR